MIIHNIESKTNEETTKIINVLHNMGIEYSIEHSICFDAFVRIVVDKKTWKKIKKELNLKTNMVFARIR